MKQMYYSYVFVQILGLLKIVTNHTQIPPHLAFVPPNEPFPPDSKSEMKTMKVHHLLISILMYLVRGCSYLRQQGMGEGVGSHPNADICFHGVGFQGKSDILI